MAKRSVAHSTKKLDPMFFIPEGASELFNSDASLKVETESGDDLVVGPIDLGGDFEVDFTDYDDIDTGDTPEVPLINAIVSQTVHRTAAGNEVVDVVIDVEDIAGVTGYELRVTKV